MTNVLNEEKVSSYVEYTNCVLFVHLYNKIYSIYITTDSIYIMAQAGSSEDIVRAIQELSGEIQGVLRDAQMQEQTEAERAQLLAEFNGRVQELEDQISEVRPGKRQELLTRIAELRGMLGTEFEVRPAEGPLDPNIEELLQTARQHIRELESASTMSFEDLSEEDKDRLQAIINSRGEIILSRHFDKLIGHLPADEKARTIKHKLLVYLLVFLDLSAKLLPKFFGKLEEEMGRESGPRLYIPDQSTEDGKTQVDHALTAVIMHMLAPRSLFESIATAIQAEYKTVGGFFASMGMAGLSAATASAASPLVASFLGAVATGATTFTPGDIVEIFKYVTTNVGYLGAATLMYTNNKDKISRAGWAIFDHTIGAGGAPREPPPRFVQLFDGMNDQFMERSSDAMVGPAQNFQENGLIGYLYLARLARTICVSQLAAVKDAFVVIPDMLKRSANLCKKGIAHVKDSASLLAHRLESRKGIRSNETYYSFRECLYGAAALPEFADLMENPDVAQCFRNMNVHVPDPFLVTTERVRGHAARGDLQDAAMGHEPIHAPFSDSMGALAGDSQNTVESVSFDREDDILAEDGGVLVAGLGAKSHTPGPLSRGHAISLAAADALRTRRRALRVAQLREARLKESFVPPPSARTRTRNNRGKASSSRKSTNPKSKSRKDEKRGGSTRRHKAKITKKHSNNRTKLHSRRK